MKLLEDKIALVTGGARGQGRAEAELFAEHGATVVLTDVLTEKGRNVADEITDSGGEAVFYEQDVAVEADWEALVDLIREEFGRLDVVVNNAGVIRQESITEETVDGWEYVLGVDLTGTWLGMKHTIPLLRDSGGGSIVNISSIYGTVGGFGNCAAYHAAKGGVTVLTKNAAVGYADDGIRANSVHPGVVETTMSNDPAVRANSTPSERLLEVTPQGRPGTAEEIAGVVLFLASDLAAFVNGVDLHVDGGYVAR